MTNLSECRVPSSEKPKRKTESYRIAEPYCRLVPKHRFKKYLKPIRFDNFSKTQMLSRKGIRSADLIRDQAVFVYFFIFPNLFKYASEK